MRDSRQTDRQFPPTPYGAGTMQTEATRETLILVPGLMCDTAVWNPLLPTLQTAADCRVADHGDADTIGTMARQVLDIAPAHFALAGHSMGGRVAIEVLRLAPGRVTRLALLDTGYKARACGAAGEDEARKRQALLDIARAQGVREMALQWVQGMLDPARLADTEMVEAIVAMFARKSPDIFARQISALLARPDATAVLRSIQVPTLVLCGRADSWSPLSQHEEIAALLPARPTVQVVDHAGHMCTMEQPAAVAQALLGWLKERRS
jgi:pimeloyl-ACP methyl ester carboxylesterase